MKKQITVIVYRRGEEGIIGYSMRSKKVWFWQSHRKVSQKILWELVNENPENFAITNIQIF